MNVDDIDERLRLVEVQVARLATATERMLGQHDDILTENGREGLVVRMDRLEQVEKKRTWTIRALVTGLVALVGRVIYGLFSQ